MSLEYSNNKRVRGEILNLLYSVHPGPAEVRTLSNTLLDSNFIAAPDIGAYIDYLMGKGYILPVDPDTANKVLKGIVPTSAFVKLSPKGIDLIEGTIEDMGVDV